MIRSGGAAQDSGIPKLTAAVRYLEEQLRASGVKTLPSRECLKDLARDAIEATNRTQRQGESYVTCVCRHLDARVRFIILWTGTDEAFDHAAWRGVIGIARKHALARPRISQRNFPAGR